VERFGLKGGEIWTQRWRDLDKRWRDLDKNPQKKDFMVERLQVLIIKGKVEKLKVLT
jgi:hypothetical protein